MKRFIDYQKEQYRGTLKQVMKVRGLRSISLSNFLNWKESNGEQVTRGTIHSLKLDLQDGYINAYSYAADGRCGEKIVDADAAAYKTASDIINELLTRESEIPYKVRRNILVNVSR